MRSVGLAACVAAVAACGQRGPLFLPQEPAAAQRATLPETLVPGSHTAQQPHPSLPPASSASTAQ
ncbi:MAG: LPS translocon maturation chaperone LptM [Giesbergeria sp.]